MMTRLLITLATIFILQAGTKSAEPCDWNPLCTCRKSHHDVVCRSVPFANFPKLPLGDIYQVTVIRSAISVLDNNLFEGTNVASLHLMQNNIVQILPKAFHGLENLLTTLDLSHNQLTEVPFGALRLLNNLQWLNLQGNLLTSIHISQWSHLKFKAVLKNLFLNDNNIISIKESAFTHFTNLTLLDLKGNYIHDVDGSSFPDGLSSLSLANNLLKTVPLHAIYTLKNLRYLYLSNNVIRKLPCPFHMHTTKLEKLDLSNNLLTYLQDCIFNGSFTIRELCLDFNFIKSVPARVFKNTQLQRLSITNNRLLNLHSDAFSGVEVTLTNLDLSFNLMVEFPAPARDLKSLLFLSLKGNYLKKLHKEDFQTTRNTLEVLDLSGNSFTSVPTIALQPLMRLTRLSLQDNRIKSVNENDFKGWSHTLTTLSLANNKMVHLSHRALYHLKKLRELKLSFNNLAHLDKSVFLPLRHSLEVLELSSAFGRQNYPIDVFIKPLENLEWLLLDNNDITIISFSFINQLKRLIHFDISSNNIKKLPSDIFLRAKYNRLNSIHISNNRINNLKCYSFQNMHSASQIFLFNNKIQVIESWAFTNCSNLHSVVLSNNHIRSIESSAFYNLSKLSNVYLQDNNLHLFSLDIFEGNTSPMNINLSNNFIEILSLGNSTTSCKLNLKSLDLTNNKIIEVPRMFSASISNDLQCLFLSYNKISNLSGSFFPKLQILHLSHNNIHSYTSFVSRCCPNVQILALDHNAIPVIEDKSFREMQSLRILDLSHNKITSLPDNAFTGTKLERLNISHNFLTTIPVTAIGPVRNSFKFLDISSNRITNLLPEMFTISNKIQTLNLSSNQITTLHELSFKGLSHLLELDLSHNELKSTFKETSLKYSNHLHALHVKNCSLMSLPTLVLPNLLVLSLKDNFFYNISNHVLKFSNQLACLDLAGNFLKDVPSHLWKKINKLRELDMSNNPIPSLRVNSFANLERLQNLDIRRLPLKWLDPRALHGLRFLTSFKTDSYASVRSFRLQDILSHASALRGVTINIEESSLSHQIQSAFGTKLRELVITGYNLRRIFPDAFSGLSTHELTIRIKGTMISEFPAGLLRYLSDVRFLTLDLRNNQLMTMTKEVLAEFTRNGLDVDQTQHILGGVLLEDNPWICSCELLWMGKWLRRWLRETFHVHMLSTEAMLYVNSVARKTKCSVLNTNVTISVIDLKSSDIHCDISNGNTFCASYRRSLLAFSVIFMIYYFQFKCTL
ncbi:chaoptin-like [Argiope bruennichi]|uniref:chaoptin-like n=1 Tax=Argiope bruennichi TaxID=94029 RepID=UPI0024945315|nr:chaoptin-like [Argiope bruennichi]